MKPQFSKFADWLGYLSLRCLVCAIQMLSLEQCDRCCRLMAILLSDVIPLRRRVTDENLDRVYGQLTASQRSGLRRRMWHHLLLMVCEVAHAPRKIHRTNWRDHFFMPQKELVLKSILDDRPTVLVTGHFGNFEVAGHTVALLGTPTTTIARPLDNPYVDAYIGEFRSQTGQTILPKEGSAGPVQDLLESAGTLGILADQHAGGKGVWVDFFGHGTSCHKALALFVLSSHATMIVNYCRRAGRPLRFEMGVTGIADPLEHAEGEVPAHLQSVLELTEWYNERLEAAIRLAPEEYWWLHRRWREVPVKQQARLAARRAKRLAAEAEAEASKNRATHVRAAPPPKSPALSNE